MEKKVIYTCVTGGYDALEQPRAVDDGFDYVCFTDGDIQTDAASGEQGAAASGVWQLRPIPQEAMSLDGTRRARYVKLLPHKVLPEYEYSVWMDANIGIEGYSFYNAVNVRIASGSVMAMLPHPFRDCVYDETVECFRIGKVTLSQAISQIRSLKSGKFPRHFGLYESNVIFRKHNDPAVVSVSEHWWEKLAVGTSRDQFSLTPVLHQLGFRPELLLGEGVNARNADCLSYHPHKTGYVKGNKLQEGFRLLRRHFGTALLGCMIPKK